MCKTKSCTSDYLLIENPRWLCMITTEYSLKNVGFRVDDLHTAKYIIILIQNSAGIIIPEGRNMPAI